MHINEVTRSRFLLRRVAFRESLVNFVFATHSLMPRNLMYSEPLSCTKFYSQRASSDNGSPAASTSRDIRSRAMTGSVSAVVMTEVSRSVFGGMLYNDDRTEFMDCVYSRTDDVSRPGRPNLFFVVVGDSGRGTRASTSCSCNKRSQSDGSADWISRLATWRHAFMSQLVPGQCRQPPVYERLKLSGQPTWIL